MSRRRSMYSLPKLRLKQKTIITIGTVVALIFAVISGVSLVTSTSKLLFWHDLLIGNLGWTAYLTPLIFLVTGLVLQRFKWQFVQPNVLLGLITITISLASLTSPVVSNGAGDIGNLVWAELSAMLTGFGAAAVLFGVLMVGLIVLFNTSASQVFSIIAQIFKFIKNNIFSPIFGRFFGPNLSEPRKISIKVSGMDDRPKAPVAQQKQTAIMADELVQNVAGQTRIWKYPPINLLSDKVGAPADRGDVKKNAQTIEKTLDAFGVLAEVAEVNGGPSVTQYALKISSGTKIAKITNLQHDLAMALAARTGTVRVEAPIPGKSLVGIEVPNKTLEIVGLKSILASDEMQKQKSKLAIALGRDTSSKEIIVDLSKMPHCLVAGTTGSGKSIMLNALIASLLYRNSPEELKLILVDPKRVEMSNYNGIPHLLTPVINEPEKILSALKWTMAEMDRRYKTFQSVGVRNIQGYNEMSGFQALPYIVLVIDELADLMLFAPVEVEDAITRLAQLARATGIHLVIATQRPSVDVITGLIKANIPCRIAFTVSSMVDSRVIIDSPGAEKLLGRGDMLFLPPDASKPMRIQGVFVSDAELNNLIDFLKSTGIAPQYTAEVTEMPIGRLGGKSGGGGGSDDRDELFDEAIKTVCQYDRASASLLQRRLRVGYARAARMIDELEAAGIIGVGEGSKPRDVLVRNADEYFAQKVGEKGFVTTAVLFVTLFLVIAGAFIFSSKFFGFSVIKQTNIPTVTPTIQKEKILIPQINYEKTRSLLDQIFQGKIEYDQKIGEVNFFSSEDKNLMIIVYQYNPQKSKFEAGYIGNTQEKSIRDLKKDVAQFLGFKLGYQKTTLNLWGYNYDVTVELRKIGDINYAITDSYFKPAGIYDRSYWTYDQKNQQLVYIIIPISAFGYTKSTKVVADQNNQQLFIVQYPQEINNFIDNFEQKVLSPL